MSFYSIIDSTFNETLYQELLINKSIMYSLKIQNWIFFIPAAYLAVVFMLGVIYSFNQDHIDFRFLHENEEIVEEEENPKAKS